MRSDLGIGSTTPTRILDTGNDLVRDLASKVDPRGELGARWFVRRAHAAVVDAVRPVYSVNEWQPASRTLRRGAGSCSQRFAVLEAVSRARGIATRVRGLAVEGRFWYPRFPRWRWLVPARVILAWPEFATPDGWVQASELFGSFAELRERSTDQRFANDGESLFEAVSASAIDWDGVTSTDGVTASCDLSEVVGSDLGLFEARDDLFAKYRTIGRPVIWAVDPILRMATLRAGARSPSPPLQRLS